MIKSGDSQRLTAGTGLSNEKDPGAGPEEGGATGGGHLCLIRQVRTQSAHAHSQQDRREGRSESEMRRSHQAPEATCWMLVSILDI